MCPRPKTHSLRRLKKAIASVAGFTLTEALATVVIVGLVTSMLAGGIALATRQYVQSMATSESQMLYASLQQILDTELRYTKTIYGSLDNVTGFESAHYKSVKVEGTDIATDFLCTTTEGDAGEKVPQGMDEPGQLAMRSKDGDLFNPLLGSGAYNYGLKACVTQLSYDQVKGWFIVTLVITDSDVDHALVEETFTVRAMNSPNLSTG